MAKRLSKTEVGELLIAFRELYAFAMQLRVKYTTAQYIHRPKVPEKLSETLVLDLIDEEKILEEESILDADFGGRKADILANTKTEVLRIEVKATGASAFVKYGEKDVAADYLVWVHFNTFFSENERLPVEVYILKNPGEYFPSKLDQFSLEQFKTASPKLLTFDFNKLYPFEERS